MFRQPGHLGAGGVVGETTQGDGGGVTGVDGLPTEGGVCDADTGLCGAPTCGGVSNGGVSNGAAVGVISPTVLAQPAGGTSSVLLMLLVVGLTLALVIVPALVWRRLARKEVVA